MSSATTMGAVKVEAGACPVCKANVYLKGFIAKLLEQQIKLNELWMQYEGYKDHSNTWAWKLSIRNDDGTTTVLPSYDVFQDIWKSSMLVSPLQYPWQAFDLHDRFDTDYLHDVLMVLDEQRNIWKSDILFLDATLNKWRTDTATMHPVFKHFDNFVEALWQLHAFVYVSTNPTDNFEKATPSSSN